MLSDWTNILAIPLYLRFGEPLVHIVSEPVRTFYVAFGMQKDSLFTAKFR